jgi:hypothetical protein
MEQAAFVTHVYGEGDEAAVPVNLVIMLDLGNPMIAGEVPFYPSRQHAMAALARAGISNGGAQVCWPRETEQ